MTTGFPVSPLTPATFLLTGLCELELREHQRFTSAWLFAASVLMTLACVALRVFFSVRNVVAIVRQDRPPRKRV
jgi:CitMHS family citrate-Mg2+:H+ or citrate-Ca2+:H+ symporter